jgi:hypothetical protein
MMSNEEEREYGAGGYAREVQTGWRRISWGAIFAGAFVTLAVFLTLQVLGAGIGASALDLTGREVTSARSLGIGAAIWWFITGLISLFIGGWVAGRLGWRPAKVDRILHGVTTWAVFYVAMFLLTLTALGALVGGGVSLLSSGVSAAGQVATSPQGQQAMQSQGINLQNLQQEIAKIMGGGASQDVQGNESLTAAINDYLKGPRTPQDRQQLAQTITQNTGMSQDQANRMISNLERTGQQAKETGEQAANVTGVSFIVLSISMLLGAVAAALGSLLAPAPAHIVEYEREHVRAGERTYTTNR